MHGIATYHPIETQGTVDRFLLNPHGDAGGLLLTDGTEVHFPPHLATQVAAAVKPGGMVMVRGVRPREDCAVAAQSLETADGTRIAAHKPRVPLFRQR